MSDERKCGACRYFASWNTGDGAGTCNADERHPLGRTCTEVSGACRSFVAKGEASPEERIADCLEQLLTYQKRTLDGLAYIAKCLTKPKEVRS